MSLVTVIKQDNSTEEFLDVVGHQVGNGAVQLMFKDGSQKIYNGFVQVDIDLDKEEQADWDKRVKQAEEKAKAALAEQDVPVKAVGH